MQLIFFQQIVVLEIQIGECIVLQATKSWAGPGNEATLCTLELLLGKVFTISV